MLSPWVGPAFALGFTFALLLAGLWNGAVSGTLDKRLHNIGTRVRNMTDKMALDELYALVQKTDISVADMGKMEDIIKAAREEKDGKPRREF